ncbi:S-layer homology domain-containing protein [Brachybacterium ginsengisoli]|nr:S-layer homology domain-containing protein [Brachybacterium ginsengisoli]
MPQLSSSRRPAADLPPPVVLARRTLFAVTAAAVPALSVGLTVAPALADPTVTDGETRILDVPLAEVQLVEADDVQVRDLPEQPATMVGVTWPTDLDAPEVLVRGIDADGEWTPWLPLETAEDPETGEAVAGTEAGWIGVVSALQILAELDGADITEQLVAHVVTTSPTTADEDVLPLSASAEYSSGTLADQAQPAAQQRTMSTAAAANPATPALVGAPSFTSRAAWGADESMVRGTSAADELKSVVVHHTAGTNDYTSAQSAQIVRGILRYHTVTLGWADIGYNLLISKHGQVFEGRSGGLQRNIVGAHAYGFNTGAFGISVMGDYSSSPPPRAAMVALAQLVGWKLLSTFRTSVTGTSSWSTVENTKHSTGTRVSLPRMFGHRDVNYTACPGDGLYARFGALRGEAQGFLDGGWKEHLWAFEGAGGAAALGTVVRSAHRTGKYTATQLTAGLVLQEGGPAYGYATPFGARWGSAWGRPTRSVSQDGDRRIQPFENGTAALEKGAVRFVRPSFSDVAPERVFFLEIQDLFAAGITEGWGSGSSRTFRPDSENLRDAMIVFLHRAMGAPAYTPPRTSPFRDVDPSFVFYKEICWAYSEGITEGWGSGSSRVFRPLEPVKRDAVAAFLYRAAGEPPASPSAADQFVDVPRSHVFAAEIGWMATSGISRGWSDGTFRPDALITRDQMAAFMIRWMALTGRS